MKNIQEYYLSEIGKTETIISIQLNKRLKVLNTKTFLKNYTISNFWKGKFFIKRLINKIFKYKLNEKMIWDSQFWGKIKIQLIASKIHYKKRINELQISSIFSQNRTNDIIKYKSLINNNIDLGQPLFITGECINHIGGNVDKKQIYMLDGSRRLIAFLLNDLKEINILLITYKN